MNNLKFAVRQLTKNPSFTIVAILTLALGIGANTAIFNLLDAVVLRSLPVPAPEQLFFISPRDGVSGLNYAIVEHLQKEGSNAGRVFAYRPTRVRLDLRNQPGVTLAQ